MSFKFEGIPKSAESVSKDSTTLTGNDGLLISAPSNTQHIIIYDILGNQIFSEKKKFNDKSILWRWEGKNKFGSKLPSGVYYVTLKNDKFIDMKKITLLK